MLFKVKLVIEYDNFIELSENIEYKVLGEETLSEKIYRQNTKILKS